MELILSAAIRAGYGKVWENHISMSPQKAATRELTKTGLSLPVIGALPPLNKSAYTAE
jgi:hypothetical protein